MPLNLQDAALLRRALRGDPMHALQLFEKYGGALYGMAFGVLGVPEQAENVVAAVAAELNGNQGKLSLTRPVFPQLARRAAAHIRRELAGRDANAPPPSDSGEDSASWQAIAAVLASASARERLAFYTWAATGLPLREAAHVLETPLDDYRAAINETLNEAGLAQAQSSTPLKPFDTSNVLFHKVEAVLVDEPELADNEEARRRRRDHIRRRVYSEKMRASQLVWLPLIFALVVIIAAIWNLDQSARKQRQNAEASSKTPLPVPTSFKVSN